MKVRSVLLTPALREKGKGIRQEAPASFLAATAAILTAPPNCDSTYVSMREMRGMRGKLAAASPHASCVRNTSYS